MATNSTNFSKVTINSENYLKSIYTEDILLLEGGDELLLESGDSMLLETLDLSSTDFTKTTTNSTDYT